MIKMKVDIDPHVEEKEPGRSTISKFLSTARKDADFFGPKNKHKKALEETE
jgi:hypothetical protein